MVTGDRSDEQVYAACAAELTRFAATLVGPGDAPDVVSDAVISALRSSHWGEAHNKRALLFRAVLLTSKSWHRSEQRRRSRDTRFATSVPLPTAVEEPEDVHWALRGLSSQQRAVVFLTYWGDMTPASSAELLGISEGSVRKQLARARRQLREVLDARSQP